MTYRTHCIKCGILLKHSGPHRNVNFMGWMRDGITRRYRSQCRSCQHETNRKYEANRKRRSAMNQPNKQLLSPPPPRSLDEMIDEEKARAKELRAKAQSYDDRAEEMRREAEYHEARVSGMLSARAAMDGGP